jgi:hypothetical protein
MHIRPSANSSAFHFVAIQPTYGDTFSRRGATMVRDRAFPGTLTLSDFMRMTAHGG